MKLLFVTLIMAGLSACSSQALIDGFEVSAKNDCATSSATQSDYTACVDRIERDSREYEAARKEKENQGG